VLNIDASHNAELQVQDNLQFGSLETCCSSNILSNLHAIQATKFKRICYIAQEREYMTDNKFAFRFNDTVNRQD
jgi:hypothetical protein